MFCILFKTEFNFLRMCKKYFFIQKFYLVLKSRDNQAKKDCEELFITSTIFFKTSQSVPICEIILSNFKKKHSHL